MSLQQFTNRDDRFVRQYEYADSWVVVADLEVEDDAVDVDIVGDTAIVVVETDEGVAETEFGLPGSGASVTTNNGVLTIAGDK